MQQWWKRKKPLESGVGIRSVATARLEDGEKACDGWFGILGTLRFLYGKLEGRGRHNEEESFWVWLADYV